MISTPSLLQWSNSICRREPPSCLIKEESRLRNLKPLRKGSVFSRSTMVKNNSFVCHITSLSPLSIFIILLVEPSTSIYRMSVTLSSLGFGLNFTSNEYFQRKPCKAVLRFYMNCPISVPKVGVIRNNRESRR